MMKNNLFLKTENKNIEKSHKQRKINNFLFSPVKTNKSVDFKVLEQTNDKDLKLKLNKKKKRVPNNLLHNRNINDYYQFVTDYNNPNNGNLSWATKLRQSNKVLNETPIKVTSTRNDNKNFSHEKMKGLSLTQNFKEPKFYVEDFEKYKLKLKKSKRPLSAILNPNFNNIKHLFINKRGGPSREFTSTLRNYNVKKSVNEKIKWSDCFNGYKENKNVTRFLLPRTKNGRETIKKLEKRIYSPYNINYKDVILGNDKIKQKIMTPKKDYIYGGIGEHLNMINYHSKYRVKNSGQAENILKAETNSQCIFELGLRNYNSLSNKKIK